MADTDHIAITSRDASTTRRKVSVPGCPVAPPITVTHGDSSDTYSRIAPDSEIVPGNRPSGGSGTAFTVSNPARSPQSVSSLITWTNPPQSNSGSALGWNFAASLQRRHRRCSHTGDTRRKSLLSYRYIWDVPAAGVQVTRSSLLLVTGQYAYQAIRLFATPAQPEPGQDEESRYRDQRVRDVPQRE
jgi:hypothetical protein